jgi:membrane-associated phospholipid phosphatase
MPWGLPGQAWRTRWLNFISKNDGVKLAKDKKSIHASLDFIQDQHLQKIGSTGLRSPGWLAKRPMIGLFMVLFGGLVFGALLYNLLVQGPLLQWDRVLSTVLPPIGLHNPAILRPIMDAGYYLGAWGIILFGILFAIYFIAKRYWQELAMLVIGNIGTSLLFWSLSNLIGRLRPPNQIWIILKIPGFPSGHALSVVTFFGLLAYLLVPKMQSALGKGCVIVLAILIMLFVGFTRVFTAAHYLTDVLSGYALGIAWSGAAYTLIEIYFQKRRSQNVKKG